MNHVPVALRLADYLEPGEVPGLEDCLKILAEAGESDPADVTIGAVLRLAAEAAAMPPIEPRPVYHPEAGKDYWTPLLVVTHLERGVRTGELLRSRPAERPVLTALLEAVVDREPWGSPLRVRAQLELWRLERQRRGCKPIPRPTIDVTPAPAPTPEEPEEVDEVEALLFS